MRRKLITRVVAPIALALAVFLIVAPGTATAASVYGVGAGSIDYENYPRWITFSFSAHADADGDSGTFRVTFQEPFAPLDVRVDVDCVNVFPNPPGAGGWIGGQVRRVTPEPNSYNIDPGDVLLLGINDYGEPSDPIPDELNFVRGLASSQICRLLPPSQHYPISQGNINISLD
jgi:hypothetical protein